MADLADFKTALASMAPGTHPVTPTDLTTMQESAVGSAMARHSEVKPREVLVDSESDGSTMIELSELTHWTDDFSALKKVEYPVDDTDEEDQELEPERWTVRKRPTGYWLILLEDDPDSGDTIRLTYTARHTCSAEACTVDDADLDAVKALAASYYCRSLAAAYALDQDSTIAADAVQHSERNQKFIRMAKLYRDEYNHRMNVRDGKPGPACGSAEWDSTYPGGGDRLTHSGKYR